MAANLWRSEDNTWLTRIRDVLLGMRTAAGTGQVQCRSEVRLLGHVLLILVLIASGIVVWDQYFYPFTTIEQKRIAIMVHSVAAVGIICVWIIHVYAAIWVKGTMNAMTSGRVTGGWAWRHHRKWLANW